MERVRDYELKAFFTYVVQVLASRRVPPHYATWPIWTRMWLHCVRWGGYDCCPFGEYIC